MNNEPNFNGQTDGQDHAPKNTSDPAQQNAPGSYAPDPFADNGKKPGRGFAIASLVLGILSAVGLCCCCTIPAVSAALGVVAIVLAIIYSQKAGKLDGMALAGLILGIIGIVVALSLMIIVALNSDAINAALEEFVNNFKKQYPDSDFGYPGW